MFTKLLLISVALVGVNTRYIGRQEDYPSYYLTEDQANILEDTAEDSLSEVPPFSYLRSRRQVQMSGSENSDKSRNYDLKIGLAGDEDSRASLSALGSVNGFRNDGRYKDASAGLLLESNRNALGASFKDIPDFGKQLTGTGTLNVLHSKNHNLDVNAFVTKTMPNNPVIPDFHTTGGNIDYNYRDKLGATFTAARTPLFQQTDYSAMGKVNLFKDNLSSFDFKGGASRSISPFRPSSSWEPSFGFTYKRIF